MLATLLLLASLLQHKSPQLVPDLLHWRIEGLLDPVGPTVVTVEPTPLGLTHKIGVKAVSVLPTSDGPASRVIAPIKSQMTAGWGVRASFNPLRQRFGLRVSLGDGSVHKIDIARPLPRSEQPQPYRVEPWKAIAPHPGRWTYGGGYDGLFQAAAAQNQA